MQLALFQAKGPVLIALFGWSARKWKSNLS